MPRPAPPDPSVSLATPRGLVTITSAPARSRRRRARAEAHRAFLADHWPELSAAAFEGFARHGAGAVALIRARGARWFRPAPFEPERLLYTTQIHRLPGATEADFDGWEACQLETYDPRSSALVVFVEGRALAGYRVAGQPSPPVALREARARDN
ncbi:hypothetical protein [Rubrivirga sp. IMCC45206]|uniref:hypothetical protein n=1 Tax=Rubrivirga sp. IMCC45206 TaxID=3391614 RepID=UPI00398FAFF3